MANRRQLQHLGSNKGPELASPQIRRLLAGVKIADTSPVKSEEEDGENEEEFGFKTPPPSRSAETPSKTSTPLKKVEKSPPRTPGTGPTPPRVAVVPQTPRRRPLRETLVSRVEERLADVEVECRKQIEVMFAEFSARLTQQIIDQRRKKEQKQHE